MSNPQAKKFEIQYRLLKGSYPQQVTIVYATDLHTARKIFEQQNPGAKVCSTPKELR